MRREVRFAMLLAIAFLSVHCTRSSEKPAAPPPARPVREVHILLFGRHPLLTAVSNGIEAGIKERQRELKTTDQIKVIVQDADFQVTNAVAQAKLAVNAKPAAVVALGTPSIKATLASAGNDIPIFFGATSDPKALGFSASPDPAAWRIAGALSGPPKVRGFVTDFDYVKIATLAAETVKSVGPRPTAKVVGYPINESEPNSVLAAQQIDAQLTPLAMHILRAPVAASLETSRATRFLLSKKVGAIQVGPDNMVVGGIGSIVAAAEADHTPVVATDRESVGKGALCAYSVDFGLLGRKLGADIVDTLHGSPPSGAAIRLFSESKLFYNGPAAEKLPKLKQMIDRFVSRGWTADAVAAQ